jgi:adenosylcobinamide-GDP ribazoletransferase
MRGLRAALAVLTRLPAGRLDSDDFQAAPGWFAAVGLILGAGQALVFLGATAVWGPALGALAALAVGVMLTGALHEDGLADTADALGARRTPERALEILRDSRIGSFGALALILTLGAQAVALAQLGAGAAPWALIAAAALSRLAAAVVLRRGPYLRASGAASGMTGVWGASPLLAASSAGAVALVVAVSGLGLAGLAGLSGLVAMAVVVAVWARARLGGVTGDVLGAVQQAGQTGFLLGVLAWP